MSLTPEREAELEERHAKIRNGWRIAEDCGLPATESEKVWEMVRAEMRFYCPDFMRGVSIAEHARQWIETRNPFHVDAAVQLCGLVGIAPPPTLASLVAEVARLRLAGDVRGGTAAKIFREAAKDHALVFMTNLCAAGLTLEQASIKAAAQLMHPQFGARYNASSLQKFYSKRWRKMESERREYWNTTDEGAAQLAEWQRIIPSLPDAPEELWGERR